MIPYQNIRKASAIVDMCDLCGAALKSGQTTLEIWRGAEMLVIKDVPADICEQCNEAYISADVSERLDYFLRDYQQRRPERYLAVPQFSAAQIMEGNQG